eukprot:474784-Pelagomonas_calceolata.AAC.4
MMMVMLTDERMMYHYQRIPAQEAVLLTQTGKECKGEEAKWQHELRMKGRGFGARLRLCRKQGGKEAVSHTQGKDRRMRRSKLRGEGTHQAAISQAGYEGGLGFR